MTRFQTVNALIVLMTCDERYVEMDADDLNEELGDKFESRITEKMMDEARKNVGKGA